MCPLYVVLFGLHVDVVQLPLVHVVPPAHMWSHVPQLALSVCVSTHPLLQYVWLPGHDMQLPDPSQCDDPLQTVPARAFGFEAAPFVQTSRVHGLSSTGT